MPSDGYDDITVARLYYTNCPRCGAQEDFAETLKEARKNRRRHVAQHMREDITNLTDSRKGRVQE